MLSTLKYLKEGALEILFPNVCKVCGLRLSGVHRFVCQDCLKERFELARPSGTFASGDIILPEGVRSQYALWKFDKGGYLQDLLHELKYNKMSGIGLDLGWALGVNFKQAPLYSEIKDPILVPVPLHPGKEKKRGYNQAREIAKGVQIVTKFELINEDAVRRVKNTQTQTGFTLDKRRKNMKDAFLVDEPGIIKGKTCILIDDVFTTGATTFELSGCLLKAGADKIVIISVAEA